MTWSRTPPPYVSAEPRERLLRIALLVIAGVSLLAALAALERYRFAAEGIRLGAVTADRFDALGQRRAILDVLLVLAAATGALLWLVWFARVYANLEALGASWTSVSVSSAVVCCVVPVLNLFMVPRLVGEAWNATDPGRADGTYEAERRFPPPFVLLWAGVLILTLLVGGLAEKIAPRTLDQLGPVRAGAPIEAVAAVLIVTSALLTIRLTSTLTARQEARAAQLEPAPQVAR